MNIISVKKQPEYASAAIKYFQEKWASKDSLKVYEDCIKNCITAKGPLPQWYLLYNDDEIVGCAGLITNDFISRMDYILGFVHYILKKNIVGILTVNCCSMKQRRIQKMVVLINYIYVLIT
jgi:hypothetical protein